MRKRRLILTLAILIGVVLISLFVVYGIPLIQDLFTPPITGLPTAPAGNSLQARFTQTALAKQSAPNAAETPQATPQ